MGGEGAGIRLRRGTVVSVGTSRPGAIELDVDVEGTRAPALVYPDLTGSVGVGDVVLLNTTAEALGLGTGGFHLVIAVEGGRSTELAHGGRVMKARYTPQQVAVRSVEETHRDVLEGSRGLRGTPVVAAPLHSMIGPVAAGAKASGVARVAYVMTDGAALPGSLSRLVPRLRDAGLLDGFITCGQAFGGELDAVTIWTGLLAAVEVLEADVVVVADGPGNLGTDMTWGVSALGSGHALNATEALGGRPVAALRVSFADARPRHRVVSHHSLTILEKVCTARANVAVPVLDDARERDAVWEALRARKLEEKHQLVEVDGGPALAKLDELAVEVESMGRAPKDDPAFFLAAGAAGVLAGRMAAGSLSYR
ncbi:MAG: DUF3866 family protein [Actinomycetota bacterium]